VSLRLIAILTVVLALAQAALATTVSITTTSLPNGTVGTPYSAVVNASGGCTPYAWAWTGAPTGVTGSPSSTTKALNLNGTPTTAATYSFSASVTGCGKHTSTKSYQVTIAPLVGVTISPTTATIYTNATEQFSASVTGTSNTAVTWTTTGGTVSASGLYTAPSSAGTFTVTATSQADTTKSATATVTVQAVQVGVTISPTSATIYVNGTEQFAAYVTGTTNTTVTWSATGGTVSAVGFYTAPSAAGTYTVTVTSQADTTKSASATVTVNPTIQHQVDLSWEESGNFTDFTVLRSTGNCGSFSALGESVALNYVDDTVVSGQTYCYTTTATFDGETSGDSNNVTVAIPYP